MIADEAHRSQNDFIAGFARHMRDALPHALFVGFTGTQFEKIDANTRAVFGDYISVYDIQRAVFEARRCPSSRRSGTPVSKPHVPDIGRARAAVDAIGIRHPRLAADLRPLIERCYTLDLLSRG